MQCVTKFYRYPINAEKDLEIWSRTESGKEKVDASQHGSDFEAQSPATSTSILKLHSGQFFIRGFDDLLVVFFALAVDVGLGVLVELDSVFQGPVGAV